jgi:hypothetical protein
MEKDAVMTAVQLTFIDLPCALPFAVLRMFGRVMVCIGRPYSAANPILFP